MCLSTGSNFTGILQSNWTVRGAFNGTFCTH